MISGAEGEAAAAEALLGAGYDILERNLRTPLGEIDLLARQGEFLCVVEVKARSSDRCGDALEALTPAKQAKLREVAAWLLAQPRWQKAQIRFDVAAVRPGPAGLAVEILEDAFR